MQVSDGSMQGTALNSVNISSSDPHKSLPDRHRAVFITSAAANHVSGRNLGNRAKPSTSNSRKTKKLVQDTKALSHRESRGPCGLGEKAPPLKMSGVQQAAFRLTRAWYTQGDSERGSQEKHLE